ncbi:NAD(P)/FAD-dependent oxidoreductase [Micrococcaceae bacterium Sec5.7]
MTETGIAIIGAGASGHSAATTLRQEGYQGPITLVHADRQGPYNRTLVNKAVLQGLLTAEQIALPALDGLGIDVVADSAVALDADRRAVRLDQGGELPYDAVIIATGANPRQTVAPAAGLRGHVFTIHTTEDAARIRDRLSTGMPEQISVTILGAGFIGAETASYLNGLGVSVDLVSRDLTPLAGAVGQAIGQSITELHRKHVRTHFGREIIKVSADSDAVTVLLDDQTTLTSDMVILAHGTVPSTDWIGNATGVGIAVDERLRAGTIEHGYAAGAVAIHRSLAGVDYRIDHWDAAAVQGGHAARTLLHDYYDAPDPGPYVPTTGFTLQLYRTSIAAFGALLPQGRQETANPGPAGGLTTAFFSDEGRMHAISGINAGRTLQSMRSNLKRP